MSSALKISVAANLVVMAVALCLARRVWMEKNSAPGDLASAAIATEPTAAPQSPRAEPNPFRWDQIESTTYPAYIANLRSIGCPEQTIRDIIVADVHSLYTQRCQELERKQAALEGTATTTRFSVGQSMAAKLQKLHEEEAAVIMELLGPQSSGPDTGIAVSSQVVRYRALDRIVSIPLAFQKIDPATMQLDRQQIEVINELRQKFQADLGGLNQDTNAPTYRKRWQQAQRESDDLLSGLLGGQFFLDCQMQASNPSSPAQ